MPGSTTAWGRQFATWPVVLCALIAVASAIGLRPAMSALALRFAKESISLRRELTEFDVEALPSFRLAWYQDYPPPSQLGEVGTAELLWVNLEGTTGPAAGREVTLFVTYYSDPRDKVPHTPDVCHRQVGTVVSNLSTLQIDVPGLSPAHSRVEGRAMRLEQKEARGALIYVFCANGEFCASRQRVRWITGWPGDRYVYFSKIEAIAWYATDAEEAQAREACQQLLREALPVLVAQHYPETSALKGR